MLRHARLVGWSLAFALTSLCVARGADDPVAELRRFMSAMKQHDVDLWCPIESGVPTGDDTRFGPVRYYKPESLDRLTDLLKRVATSGNTDSAFLLVQAAVHRPVSDPLVERKNWTKEQPWLLRRLAREALVGCTLPTTDAWLIESVLVDRNPMDGASKRALAANVLAERMVRDAAPRIAQRLTDPVPEVRAAAARALGTLGGSENGDRVKPALRDDDNTVRLEALLALERIATTDLLGPQRAASIAAARAGLEDPDWSVRLASAEILGRSEHKDSIPPLILALGREQADVPGSRHRVRSGIRDALGALTNEDFSSTRPGEWEAWWAEAQKEFEIPREKRLIASEQTARFFGLSIDTDEVVFLLDISGSMEQPVIDDASGPSRYVVAVREFERCMAGLANGVAVNVVLFQETITPFSKEPVKLDDDVREQISKFVRSVKPTGGTDLHAALELALGASRDRLVTHDVDTIVLLSDGIPSRGVVLSPEQILYEIGERNRAARITLHTVDSGGIASEFMRQLAIRNGGEFASMARGDR